MGRSREWQRVRNLSLNGVDKVPKNTAIRSLRGLRSLRNKLVYQYDGSTFDLQGHKGVEANIE